MYVRFWDEMLGENGQMPLSKKKKKNFGAL